MPQDRFSPSTRVSQLSPVPDADYHHLREVAGGSSEALGLFYDRHASLVLGLLCRMLGDRSEAEEVLQEVFLQVWRDARSYDRERSSPRGWLLLIARSRALDRRRATVSRRRREDESVRREVTRAVTPLGTRRLEHGESSSRIGSALERLPPEQRRVLELAFWEGLTQTQIAEALGTPLGTVKSRALLAMRKLRGMLARDEELELLQA